MYEDGSTGGRIKVGGFGRPDDPEGSGLRLCGDDGQRELLKRLLVGWVSYMEGLGSSP